MQTTSRPNSQRPAVAIASVLLVVIGLTWLGAAVVIVGQRHQLVLSSVLVVALALHVLREWHGAKSHSTWMAEIFLVITTATIGYLTESWGTIHGYWTYAHMESGQTVPAWVPLAWACAGILLHKIECRIHTLSLSRFTYLAICYVLGMLLPLLGESVCIAAGVWTYHWPWQLLGVPVLALALISYAHLSFSMMRLGAVPSLRNGGKSLPSL